MKTIYLYFEHASTTEGITALRQMHQQLWEAGNTVIVAPYWWVTDEGRASSRDLRAFDEAAVRLADEVVFFSHNRMPPLTAIACAVIGHVIALGKPLRFPSEPDNGDAMLEAHAHDLGTAVAFAFTNGVRRSVKP